MKPKYTIIVKDNETNSTLFDFDASNINYHFNAGSPKEGTRSTTAALTMDAQLILDTDKEEGPKIYQLDEEMLETLTEDTVKIVDCSHGHSWTSHTGLFEDYQICVECGVKKHAT